ncbi:hypothetical protein [Cerasicoccus maritimus]|uniref:hypothetical protein n=1 Tax=Cerasicoccus maritimus TaxID=490089 RepID=UPI002852CB41|nr:hypothetical protein [Cerasicoccus maritimus]
MPSPIKGQGEPDDSADAQNSSLGFGPLIRPLGHAVEAKNTSFFWTIGFENSPCSQKSHKLISINILHIKNSKSRLQTNTFMHFFAQF